jgi:hypothetical protein
MKKETRSCTFLKNGGEEAEGYKVVITAPCKKMPAEKKRETSGRKD